MAGPVASKSTSSPSHPNRVLQLFPPAPECSYVQNYCEENVWMLCEHVRKTYPAELEKCSAVFVSNKDKTVPLWCQRVAVNCDLPLVWDYHVIFMYQPDQRCLIYDLDSVLPFPTYLHKYVTETFRSDDIFKPNHHRFFRVIPAPLYLETFASDRHHMKRPDNTWLSPPPPYPPIKTKHVTHNLDSFISMDVSNGPGIVYNLKDFVRTFYKP